MAPTYRTTPIDPTSRRKTHGLFGTPATSRAGWSALGPFSLTDWNTGVDNFAIGGVPHSTSSIGEYSTLFGEDLYAILFARGDAPITESNDDDQADWSFAPASFFYFQSFVNSNFVALDAGGGILDGTLTAVPEAGAGLMLGLVVAVAGAASGIRLMRKTAP